MSAPEDIWNSQTATVVENTWNTLDDMTVLIEKTRYTVTGLPTHLKVTLATTTKTPKYQKLSPDYSIKIPLELAEKLNWEIGSELFISAYDDELSQAIIGKKLVGKEFKQGLKRLRQRVAEDIEASKTVSE